MGSIVTITDSSGDIVEKYFYDAYGNVIIKGSNNNVLSQSAINNRYMFTAREYDAETGLYYYRARMYSSELGRFLQPDPISYYDSMNLYQYVKNNPVNFIDPFGLCNCREICIPSEIINLDYKIFEESEPISSWKIKFRLSTFAYTLEMSS